MNNTEYSFSAEIKIIGINPYVSISEKILKALFKDANKSKGAIPISGTINEIPYLQTLVKYAGEWRLYINTTMLKDSPKRIGEIIKVKISFDSKERIIKVHPLLKKALEKNKTAKAVFENISPSSQKEIVRYISNLKTEKSIQTNVTKAISFLLGKGKFGGREKP
ncbi:MAG TPA: YdeI/OmpD-associated family protein [Chryseolinea sp.]|nr:YdeI/OmpD-associated family protein [Chryseolinea sp.]HPM29740.1 YdeI/OmpD-associated family protein [Chryseolinea sp.]